MHVSERENVEVGALDGRRDNVNRKLKWTKRMNEALISNAKGQVQPRNHYWVQVALQCGYGFQECLAKRVSRVSV